MGQVRRGEGQEVRMVVGREGMGGGVRRFKGEERGRACRRRSGRAVLAESGAWGRVTNTNPKLLV